MNHPNYGRNEGKGKGAYGLLAYPALMILVFFVLPLGIMLAVSFFKRIQSAFFEPAFVFDNYARAFGSFFLERMAVSLGIALLAAAICLLLAFPFTFFLTRLRRKRQVPYLVLCISVLSLSEVIIAFSWSLLLSRTSGISQIFVTLGVMDKAVSWSPSLAAMVAALVYIALPLAIIVLYPALSRLDNSLLEAASTLGASARVRFFSIVLPYMRTTLLSSFILIFIFVLGSYLIPQQLGRPKHWTLPVHITDQVLQKSNMPLAAALAMVLLLASTLFSLITLRLGNRS